MSAQHSPDGLLAPYTRRHLLSAAEYRQIRTERFGQWREAARLQSVA